MPTPQPSIQSSVDLLLSPSGRAIAEAMENELLQAIQHHLNQERQAHVAYFAAAIWCAERELRGFASYFSEESKNEHIHAEKFSEYLISRGQTIQLDSLERPKQSWISIEDIMATSFLMESDLTTSLQQLYAMAERNSDIRTTVFLDPMIEKQNQAEHEFAHLLGRVRFAENHPSALLIIDNELNQGKHQPAQL